MSDMLQLVVVYRRLNFFPALTFNKLAPAGLVVVHMSERSWNCGTSRQAEAYRTSATAFRYWLFGTL